MELNENISQALILVSGRVQGVYFRAYAKQQALALNLAGYARNLADGRVEIKAQGMRSNIEKLISWCYQGSPYAQVKQVEHQWQQPQFQSQGFNVC